MSAWMKLIFIVVLAITLTVVELLMLQTIVWWFELTFPTWLRMVISDSKLYVFIVNMVISYFIFKRTESPLIP